MRATIYRIDGVNEEFENLYDAKNHVWFLSPSDRLKTFGNTSYIKGVNERKGEIVSLTEIKVDERGCLSFGRCLKH